MDLYAWLDTLPPDELHALFADPADAADNADEAD